MDQGKKLTNTSSSTSPQQTSNGSSHKASDMIQDTIDVVDNFPRSSSNNNNNDTSSSTTTNNNNASSSSSNNNNNTTTSSLTHIDNTLNALDHQYPFSNEHRARPHSSTLSSSSMGNKSVTDQSVLRSQLGAFSQPGLANYQHPYNPLHWGPVGALRNPYGAPYSQARTATTKQQGKNPKNPRAQSYEDKMDKQRLEHILFSGDQSGPLNQVCFIFTK